MVTSLSVPAGVSLNESIFLRKLYASDNGLLDSEAKSALPDLTADGLMELINGLAGQGLISFANRGSEMVYEAVDPALAQKMVTLSGEERVVYQTVANAKNEGIWTRHIRDRTNLPQTNMTRVIKVLESRGLIKSIKSVKFPTKKIYMLAELTPSTEVTGGPWFSDQELDIDFIRVLSNHAYRFIFFRSFPKRGDALFTIHANLPSTQDVQRSINDSGVIKEILGVEHVHSLLEVLELDGRIERRNPMADMCDWGMDEEEANSAWVWKAMKEPKNANVWMDIPCGSCPMFEFCSDNGPVTPKNCLYIEQWLDM